MGIYDRDYYRQGRPVRSVPVPRTAVGGLIFANVLVYVVDQVLLEGKLAGIFGLTAGALPRPWYWWQLVTYGFLHLRDPMHIIMNMLGLFFFGREIEEVYGSREFLRLYLAMVVLGGLAWAAGETLRGGPTPVPVVGASAGVTGVIILFALHFPRRPVHLFFIWPIPAWILGALLVAWDALSAARRPDGSNIAYLAHLGGTSLAVLYFALGWNFGRWWPGRFSLRWLRARPKFRVFTPDDEPETPDLHEEVDRILEKISRQGEASLTRQERRTLETASRQYQKRRQRFGR